MNQTISIPQPSPLYLHTIFLFLIFITACSVFKEKSFLQADSLLKHNIKRETKTEENTQMHAVRVYNHQDSSENRLFTEIFPDGVFTYSAKSGFSGNATRVTINGSHKTVTKAKDSATITSESNKVFDVRESERLLTQTRLKKKTVSTRNYTLFYLAGILVLFAAIFIFRFNLND